MPLRALLWLLLAAAAASSATPSGAQDARTHVRWEALPATVGADGAAEVRVQATLAPGWKMYALASPPPSPALRVTVDTVGGPSGIEIAGPLRHVPAPLAVFDSLLGIPVEQVSGVTEVRVPLRIGASASERVPLAVRFAVCDASICLPPRTVRVEARLVGETRPPASPPEAVGVAVGVPPVPVPALGPDSAEARIGPAPPIFRPTTSASGAPPNPARLAREPEPDATGPGVAAQDGPRVPRLLLVVLVGAALVRALLFVLQRRSERTVSGKPRGRDDQNGAGGVLENGPRDAA